MGAADPVRPDKGYAQRLARRLRVGLERQLLPPVNVQRRPLRQRIVKMALRTRLSQPAEQRHAVPRQLRIIQAGIVDIRLPGVGPARNHLRTGSGIHRHPLRQIAAADVAQIDAVALPPALFYRGAERLDAHHLLPGVAHVAQHHRGVAQVHRQRGAQQRYRRRPQ
ncbi:hypothetical protein GGER_06680 [Serratia rubidaea]